jgi:energy-coupling factor transporter ATP-binding protein EcfA2
MASEVSIKAPKSVLHDIYEWSIGRPSWLRDALRRIITNGKLDDADLTELEHLCRQTPNPTGVDGKPLAATPLAEEHLPAGPSSKESVTIEYLNDLAGVNKLPSGQKITFGTSPGLTIFYGDNGSGKSGYARVIKKACRSRGTAPVIRPDAFSETPVHASCKIGINVSGTGSEIHWKDNQASDAKLASVFVFDGDAAKDYLTADGPASFTPFGLDVLPKLSKACDALATRIRNEVANVTAAIEVGKTALNKYPNTAVGATLDKLNSKTSSANVLLLGKLTDTETKRLAELRTLLSSDPKKKAAETRAAKKRIETFKTLLLGNAALLSAEKINQLKIAFENTAATEAAAKAAAESKFAEGVVTGTGSDLWRAMWDAAKSFSTTTVYPGKDFPQTGNQDRCVLCQRPFGDDAEAVALAGSFVKFCNEDVQNSSKTARKKLNTEKAAFETKSGLKAEHEKIATDLAALTEIEIKLLAEFIVSADDCLSTVKKSFADDKWAQPVQLAAAPTLILTVLIENLEKRAVTEESADDPVARKKLQTDLNELAAKEWLNTVEQDVKDQIQRFKNLDGLNERLADTRTNQITTKNSELTQELITDAYCKRFADELAQLGIRSLSVNLEAIGGAKGEKKFGVRLQGAKGKANVFEIASEGEQRCIALASFLAELSQCSHNSALVFDDPVSSLDHFFRGRIAFRLSKEAQHRQVIVFTHDTVFLNDLISEAGTAKVPCSTFYLRWEGSNPGKVEAGLPWDCKSPQDRLDKLEKMQKALEKKWQPYPDEALKAEMGNAYSDLRATLERIIEKVIFADVVFRFRSYVNLGRLDEVVGFSQTECDEVLRLFKKCCDYTPAHDAPAGKHATVPAPAELAKDIDDTKKLLETIKSRRKTIKVAA